MILAVEVESWAVASTVVRFGLTPLLEVQIGVTPYQTDIVTNRLTGVEDRVEGVGDLFFGARQSLLSPDGSGLPAALQRYLTVPTGSDAVRGRGRGWGRAASFDPDDRRLDAGADARDRCRPGRPWRGVDGAYALTMSVDRDVGQ